MLIHTFEWSESRTIGDAPETFRVRAYGTERGWVVFERPETEIWWTEVPTTETHLERIRHLLERSNDSDSV
jgi:hypothetical protein